VSPIAAYLDELAGLLRRGARRRRILAEVRTHLLDAAAAAREPGEEADAAQRRAVARFGSPPEVARAFNAIHRRRHALVRRAAAVTLAGAATASVGTATVWALEPGASGQARAAGQSHAAVHAQPAGHHHHPHDATETAP
jgi:hypothetical protein